MKIVNRNRIFGRCPTPISPSVVVVDSVDTGSNLIVDWTSDISPVSWQLEIWVDALSGPGWVRTKNLTIDGALRHYDPSQLLGPGDLAYAIVSGVRGNTVAGIDPP